MHRRRLLAAVPLAAVLTGTGLVAGRPASVLSRTSFTVSTLKSPSRVVIDVAADHPRTSVPVSFVDRKRFASGTSPYVRAVPRFVPSGAPAGGAMHRLFARPTAAEYATG